MIAAQCFAPPTKLKVMKRTLTKSRYKLALECPTKLFYTGKRDYFNAKSHDPFLAALAEGGFQVGELAKVMHPEGHDITTLNADEALAETEHHLENDECTLFEAAIAYEQCFIRIDILKKRVTRSGVTHFDLIEVKSKSHDPEDPNKSFLTKQGKLRKSIAPYLHDVTFQKWVLRKAFPDARISTYLMLADTSRECDVDGLNQMFKVHKDERGRTCVQAKENISQGDIGRAILSTFKVDSICDDIIAGEHGSFAPYSSFAERVKALSEAYFKDIKIPAKISSVCKDCEFRCTPEELITGQRSGLEECFSEARGLSISQIRQPTLLNLWNNRKINQQLEAGLIFLSDFTEDDFELQVNEMAALTTQERQYLQVKAAKESSEALYVDRKSLREEMLEWTYPYHCIDFETMMAALPFNAGMRPYEGVAFQFSHHTIDASGKVTHANQFLETRPGRFPNFEFLRVLKKGLDQDDGTVFCYSPHENTFLNHIRKQLCERSDSGSPESDHEALVGFIDSLTRRREPTQNTSLLGPRVMVDLWVLIKKYYFDPRCAGSNSIKAILPSLLYRSHFLQEKYSKPIYGAPSDTKDAISSLNFTNHTWVRFDEDDQLVNPYRSLPKVFAGEDHAAKAEGFDSLLKDGAGAMTAYARLQFEEIDDDVRDAVNQALLRYCELDTLAMVMLIEGLKDLCSH